MKDYYRCQIKPEKKKKVIHNGETYLVKFPDPIREKGNLMA